jgi:hypothetical protein
MASGKRAKRPAVIACRVFEPELQRALDEMGGEADLHFLPQALHRTPARLPALLQEAIDAVAPTASRIVLGYGLCSNGVVGVTARSQGLIVPRCHDCIALFLGSPERYQAVFRERPGTYYLTPGWVAQGDDPLGILAENAARYGEEKARWVLEEEFKHYTHIALIDTGGGDLPALRARAQENAAALKKVYLEIPGSLDFFRQLLRGPYPAERFVHLGPGETLAQEPFFATAEE